MAQNFKGIVKLSEENYIILSTTGTLTLKDGSILTYDPIGTLYITEEIPKEVTPDTTPTKDSTNTITSGGVYDALDKVSQSYEQLEADNATIIKSGTIVKQMATFSVTGNTEKIWSFPYSYDTGKKPIVWVNSVEEGNNVSNGQQ